MADFCVLFTFFMLFVLVACWVFLRKARRTKGHRRSVASGQGRAGWDTAGSQSSDADRYFELLPRIRELRKAGDFRGMAACCRESIKHLRGCVYDGVAAPEIPALEDGCNYWEQVGDLDTLLWVRGRVSAVPEIARMWIERVDEAIAFVQETRSLRASLNALYQENPTFPETPEAVRLAVKHRGVVDGLVKLLRANPGLPQNKLRQELGIAVKDIAALLKCLEQEGYLRREKAEGTYRLYLSR